jgi:hypothetical protein
MKLSRGIVPPVVYALTTLLGTFCGLACHVYYCFHDNNDNNMGEIPATTNIGGNTNRTIRNRLAARNSIAEKAERGEACSRRRIQEPTELAWIRLPNLIPRLSTADSSIEEIVRTTPYSAGHDVMRKRIPEVIKKSTAELSTKSTLSLAKIELSYQKDMVATTYRDDSVLAFLSPTYLARLTYYNESHHDRHHSFFPFSRQQRQQLILEPPHRRASRYWENWSLWNDDKESARQIQQLSSNTVNTTTSPILWRIQQLRRTLLELETSGLQLQLSSSSLEQATHDDNPMMMKFDPTAELRLRVPPLGNQRNTPSPY